MLVELETFIFGIALLYAADLHHFTWWAVISLIASNTIFVLANNSYHRIERAAASIATFVSCAVVILSLAGCKLFANALNDHGTTVYVLGNFALHYWPSLRLLYRMKRVHNSQPAQKTKHVGRSVLQLSFIPAHLLLLYCALNDPTDQYMCGANLSHNVFVAINFFASIGIELLFCHAWQLHG